MEIDKNLGTELKKLINSNQNLKKMLENTDRSKVEELMKGVDLSKVDMQEIANKLRQENPQNIANNLENMIGKYFGGKNG